MSADGPVVPPEARREAQEAYDRAHRAMELRWDASLAEEARLRVQRGVEAAGEIFFAAGVAAGRTRAAQDPARPVIQDSEETPDGRG